MTMIMRTIIELPETQLERVKPVLRQEGISRAELIRRAVNEYLKRYPEDSDDAAFGLRANRAKDGLEYQEELRSEWD